VAGALILMPFLMPEKVNSRVKESFQPGKTYTVLGKRITVDESTAERIDAWQIAFEKLGKQPVFGYGIPAASVIDNQFTRVMVETGILGTLAYLWIIATIFRLAYRSYVTIQNDFAKGLSLGFLCGFIGLLAHSFSAATFIIIRIMEPFWFIAAMVIILPELKGLKRCPTPP
jgi:O-antigen ligase